MRTTSITPRVVASLAAVLVARLASAQTAPGDPDVFLVRLDLSSARVTIGSPVNITARAGYDNQPSFAPDGGSVFYTSVRSDRQADIYRYDIRTRATSRVTVTAPQSEYSAAVIPGTDDLAIIRVERDSTQRLWRFPLRLAGRSGAEGSVLLEHVKPAGYFAFADSVSLALFVLGRPNSLQLANARNGHADTIVVNVGRSLHRIPGQRAISYVSKAYDNQWWIMSLDLATRHMLPLARLPEGVEDYAWLPDGRLVAGKGSSLLVCSPASDAVWNQVADLTVAGITNVTRLAVAPGGDWLAIVGVPKSITSAPRRSRTHSAPAG
ncbi:MAG: TolB family protein [Gemmatimonadaceae bacterium]